MERLQSEAETVIDYNEGLKQILDRYIRQYGEDIRHILKLDQDELETEDIEVLNITSEIIYEAFGIKVTTFKKKKDKENGQKLRIRTIWIKYGELIIPKLS
jgi:retron-type reverse transcriptase